MKKIILSALSLCFCALGFSQSFEVAGTEATFNGSHTDSDFGGYISLINNTTGNLSLKWKRTDNNIPTGWQTSICDPTSCKTPEVDSSNFVLPKFGSSNYINIHFYPENIEGIGTTKVRVENPNDASNFYVLSFVGDARTTTGINDESFASAVSMYPNPTNGVLNVRTSNNDMLTITIYNLIGEAVMSVQGYGNVSEDLSSLDSGIYLVNVNNGTNNFTEKLLVK